MTAYTCPFFHHGPQCDARCVEGRVVEIARNYVPQFGADGRCGVAERMLTLDDRIALVRAGVALRGAES